MRRTIRSLFAVLVLGVCGYAGMVLSEPAVAAGESVSSKCSTVTCSATLRCCAPYACYRGRCLID